MTRDRQYSGSAGNPIQLRTTRQTEPQRSQRLTRTPCVEDEENTDAWTVEKPHTSAVRYDRPPHMRTSKLPEYQKTTRMRRHSMDRWTLLIIVSLLVIVMLGGWWLFSTVTSWWTNVQDDWKYGSIRTYQADQFVGQGDSTDHPDHFIC